jgi:calmodulin
MFLRFIFSTGNGEVDFEEFLVMMKNQMQNRDADAEMKEAFRVFDRNGDGSIR